ncbi:OmpA family protein [Aquibium carbonis]|uniref:OmpA family protein n=1 Tax=Aquibium carbonis TaxID=2495581 RepID=A0A429YTS8_9HYPH|nr:OmpA family protein [Aquibium carbonis]
MTMRIWGLRATALGAMALVAAGCSTASLEPPVPDVTNAPAAGFANLQPGSEEDFILNVGRRTYFTEGSAALDSVAKTTIDNQIAWLKKHPRWLVKLQGFADDPGGDAAMTELSRRRAEAVMNYMIAGGIDRDRLWAKGYGKERVVRDCTEASCRVQNRRVISNLREEKDGAA